jgi:hypothetical protein
MEAPEGARSSSGTLTPRRERLGYGEIGARRLEASAIRHSLDIVPLDIDHSRSPACKSLSTSA